MTLKVIHQLQAFSNAIRRTFVQHFTRFQLTVCSRGSSALAELLVIIRLPNDSRTPYTLLLNVLSVFVNYL